MNDMKNVYQSMMYSNGFVLSKEGDEHTKYTLTPEKGEGYFSIYFYKDMFEVTVRDFVFYEDFLLECPIPEFLSVTYYTSVSGEEFHPYRMLSSNSLYILVGNEQERQYQALFHKNVPIRYVQIAIMPAFYQQYLQQKFPGEFIDVHGAFKQFAVKTVFPEMVTLLKQIQHYNGTGLSAKMFYEGKILEAIALIIQRAKENATKRKTVRSDKDIENLQAVAAYLNNHSAYSIPTERLCRIAFMGRTKLKNAFREYYGCTITEYVLQRRMERAQHLLMETDLSIREISKVVGYERADSFTRQFRKSTGVLPREYRNMIMPN